MTNPKARERNKAILADSATGKYTAAELAKKYNVSKQHIYNLRSDAKKQGRLRREKLKEITNHVMQGNTTTADFIKTKAHYDRAKETQDLLNRFAESQREVLRLTKMQEDLELVISDLIARNKTLTKVIDKLVQDD